LIREYKRRNFYGQFLYRVFESLAAAIYGALILERCNFGGIRPMLAWLSGSLSLIIPGILALFCVYSLLRIFLGKPLLAFSAYGAMLCFIGMSHFYKLGYRLEPLLPYDLFNIGTALSIAEKMSLPFDSGLLLNFLSLIVCLVALFYVSRRYYSPVYIGALWKYIVTPVCLIACFTLLMNIPRLAMFGAEDIRYDQNQNYRRNGFLAASLMNLSEGGIKTPKGYSAKMISDLRDSIIDADDPKPLGKPRVKPHIIVLQMESYADPGFIDPRVSYETSPFSPLWPYSKGIRAFRALTSVLGGGTANTEFEFLTGYNMSFCPSGVIPFIRYKNHLKSSIATDLADIGYNTIAVHPYTGSFYNRDKAFPSLGIERFVTYEDFDSPEYIGGYISDDAFAGKVIELYEEEKTRGPVFLYGMSIQNHGPYNDPQRYRPYPVLIGEGLDLSEDRIRELELYGANLRDSSLALARIMDYLSKTREHALLLVFGDHQPAWGWAYEMPGSADLEMRRYASEGFFWANYPLEERELIRPLISVSALGPYTMRMAGLELPLYAKGLYLQFNELMAYNTGVMVENDGVVAYADKARLEPFRALAYDRVFGKNYLKSLESRGR